MASAYIESLLVRRAAIVAELSVLDSTKAGGKPNLSQTDGGTAIDHMGYKKSLYNELKMIDEAIARDGATQAAIDAGEDGPFEIATGILA